MYIVRILNSNANVAYKCTNTACPWESAGKNIDWGSFDETNGNCESCIDLCDKQQSCQAVECGNGYCSWWKNDKCINPSELDNEVQTCTKLTNGIFLKL